MLTKMLPRAITLVLLALAILGGALAFAAGLPAPQRQAPEWQEKVDSWVLQGVRDGSQAEFLVFMQEQASLEAARNMATKEQRGQFVFERLHDTANRTQGPLRATLRQQGVAYQPFWIANMIWVRGSRDLVKKIALRGDVAHIYANPRVAAVEPIRHEPLAPHFPQAVEWNVAQVNAPAVWQQGIRGDGAIIGAQDTGYDWDHPALKEQYRGWNGSNADHNYNWHDAIHSGGGICGPDSPEPCDDQGHGTHTMGTMVGDDGSGNQIGVAPGAQWIGCRNMDQGFGTPATYSECFQWFVAPTDLNGANPDPARAPHVINNSWSCPPFEGCDPPTVLQAVVENTRAAGIVVVVSAGNEGSQCETIDDPAAIYEAAFTVGATDGTNLIASFSSRGPVTIDDSGRLKPDVVAPGVSVRSSVPGDAYGYASGTSMAAPHVTGLVALLLQAEPYLSGHVGLLESLMVQGAKPLTSGQECGNVSGSTIPNNTYGYGRIDASASLDQLANVPLYTTFLPVVGKE